MVSSISASVGQRAVNRKPDVVSVQSQLNRAPIERGGPVPALKVDGLCYGKTLAAIGRFQKIGCGFRWPDKRIDPNGRTWGTLVKCADEEPPSQLELIQCFPPDEETPDKSRPSLVIESQRRAAPSAASLVRQATITTPLAMAWVMSAQTRLRRVRGSLSSKKVYSKAEIKEAQPFSTHFKIHIKTQSHMTVKARLARVEKTFGLILQALMAYRLVGHPNKSYKALANLGGFHKKGYKIMIGAGFVNGHSSNLQAAVLIHEGAHFVDANCGHVASERPAPNGSAITDANGKKTNPGRKNYKQMKFDLAIKNAYSFAQCAAHCGLGRDQRPL